LTSSDHAISGADPLCPGRGESRDEAAHDAREEHDRATPTRFISGDEHYRAPSTSYLDDEHY
jgi:hypothetical protein